jgi:hypothetical protein
MNGIVLWSVYVSGKKELGLIRPFRLSHRLPRLMGLHTEVRTSAWRPMKVIKYQAGGFGLTAGAWTVMRWVWGVKRL